MVKLKSQMAGAAVIFAVAGSFLTPAQVTASEAGSQTSLAAQDPLTQAEKMWIVNADKSSIIFTGVQNGKSFEGRFKDFDATIVFDPDNLEASSINVLIDPASAKTGDKQRDRAIVSSDWFDVKSFPTAQFSAMTITAAQDGGYEAAGTLKIRDVAQKLTLPFTLTITGDEASASGAVTLIRSDFGVGQGKDFETGKWVGLEVGVAVKIEAVRSSAL